MIIFRSLPRDVVCSSLLFVSLHSMLLNPVVASKTSKLPRPATSMAWPCALLEYVCSITKYLDKIVRRNCAMASLRMGAGVEVIA